MLCRWTKNNPVVYKAKPATNVCRRGTLHFGQKPVGPERHRPAFPCGKAGRVGLQPGHHSLHTFWTPYLSHLNRDKIIESNFGEIQGQQHDNAINSFEMSPLHSAAGRHEMKKNFSRVLDGATRIALRDCVQRSLQGGGEGVFWICNYLQREGRGGFGFATTTLSFMN